MPSKSGRNSTSKVSGVEAVKTTVIIRKELYDWLREMVEQTAGYPSAKLLSLWVNKCLEHCKEHAEELQNHFRIP